MDQRSRTQTLDDFRKDKLKLLVASDVAARGLDIPAVSHIFNFDVPTHAEDYIHRIGRTGRAGLKGTSITIATALDRKYIAGIERLIGHPIPPMEVEAGPELAASFNKGRGRSDDEAAPKSTGEGRHGRRERGRRHEGPRAEVAKPESHAAPAAVAPTPAAPRAEARHDEAPRHQEPHRSEPRHPEQRRDEHHLEQRPRERQRQDAPRRDFSRPRDHRRDHDRDDGPRVIGLGDHVPDFLRRAVKIPTSSE